MQGCLGRPCLGAPAGQQLLAFPLGLMDLPGSFLEGAGLAANLRMLGGSCVQNPMFVPSWGPCLNAAGVPGPESVYLVQGVILQTSTGWG